MPTITEPLLRLRVIRAGGYRCGWRPRKNVSPCGAPARFAGFSPASRTPIPLCPRHADDA